tara:strand:+ start:100411 stop:102399 length:1989 start_codon:yes stop_codon:yes gene_type:complete
LLRIAFFTLLYSAAAGAEEDVDTPEETLRVMLQGGSASELSELVEQQGGQVSHSLHLINAVGAILTRAQLDEALKSELVTRHIDDLAIDAIPDETPETSSDCEIGAGLELRFTEKKAQWRLFNKSDQSALLEHIEIRWPATLGKIKTLSLEDTLLQPASYEHNKAGKIVAAFSTAEDSASLLPPKSSRSLGIAFTQVDSFSGIKPPRQSDFSITASFSGDCKVELAPAYDNNHENFYYPQVVGADVLHRNGITGKGVTVAVLDSGLWEHPSLALDTAGKRRVLAYYNAINGAAQTAVFDESGHGSHMTSILAHSGATQNDGKPNGSYKGIAPDVNLVIVKAFNVHGQGDFLDIVRGIQWVVDNKETYGIRVLNLSFAARPRWNYWQDPVNQAVMRAWAAGITVVAAAGNEGPEPMTIGSPGNLPYVITVGANTDSWTPDNRDDDYIPDFSSQGPTPEGHIKPDIIAPGGHITGVTRPGSTLMKQYPEYRLETGEFVMTGTSQASALVAGIAALLIQLEPDLSPDDVKCKLTSSAEPAINSDGFLAYSPFQQGQGLISATRAVTLGESGCGNVGLDIHADIAGFAHYQGPAIVTGEGKPSLPGLDEIVSSLPASKGMSEHRKWGVKDHIESLPDQKSPRPEWIQLYHRERDAIERLRRAPAKP